ncbi:diacylglycerol kinase [Marininema halotolerans]|uniref:Diacylglycerol kinase (ATP) n=1 Tax=Marininema halotolerans TaxID=1155944 RepID=A0A1I6NRI2_9BACL|nr:diacylglycerol kinase [Marininema halotolerans]SFS30461.1 diacylglycerol kinase (ATP) [Marininema halotolerans]
MKRARIIYNRTAGKECIERELPGILERLESYELETSCHATRCEGDALEAARQSMERGFDIVIAAGGDGTIHEVVNGLALGDKRPRLGILPCGTSNDFARSLKLPKDLIQACDVIGQGQFRPMDVGRLGERFFINVAAAGWLTEVSYEAPSRLKAAIGPLAYYAKGLEKIGSLLRPFTVQLETSEGRFSEEIMLFMVANSSSIGGFEKLAPQADISDGKMDVLVVKKGNLADLIQLLGLVRKGEHIHDDRILYFQTDRLQVISEKPMQLNLDGEWGGELSGKIEILGGYLDVCSPMRIKQRVNLRSKASG